MGVDEKGNVVGLFVGPEIVGPALHYSVGDYFLETHH